MMKAARPADTYNAFRTPTGGSGNVLLELLSQLSFGGVPSIRIAERGRDGTLHGECRTDRTSDYLFQNTASGKSAHSGT